MENQLRAIVQVYHPAVLHLFSSLDRGIALSFIRDYPTPEQARRIGEGRMEAFCARHGYSGRTRPEVLVERLRANLLTASSGTTAGKAFTALLVVEQLQLLNDQVRAITKVISDLLHTHPDAPIFLSFPGMGDVTATTMVAEMGADRARFPTAAVLMAESGTAPVTRSSGRSRNVRFRYAANKRMRHAIDWWAFVSVRENDWAHDAYQQARDRGQQRHRALRGVGARWVRILWKCWIDHTTYDPTLHLKRTAEQLPAQQHRARQPPGAQTSTPRVTSSCPHDKRKTAQLCAEG